VSNDRLGFKGGPNDASNWFRPRFAVKYYPGLTLQGLSQISLKSGVQSYFIANLRFWNDKPFRVGPRNLGLF